MPCPRLERTTVLAAPVMPYPGLVGVWLAVIAAISSFANGFSRTWIPSKTDINARNSLFGLCKTAKKTADNWLISPQTPWMSSTISRLQHETFYRSVVSRPDELASFDLVQCLLLYRRIRDGRGFHNMVPQHLLREHRLHEPTIWVCGISVGSKRVMRYRNHCTRISARPLPPVP